MVAPILPAVGSPTPCRDCGCACNTAANGKVPNEEADALFLDLENGPMDYTTAPPQPDIMTKIATMVGMTEAEKVALDMDAARITKCIFRVSRSTLSSSIYVELMESDSSQHMGYLILYLFT